MAMAMAVSACGGKYDDAIEVNTEFGDAAVAYIDALDNADNAKAAVDAVNDFAAAMEKLGPRMKEITEKYPELNDPANHPDELKESSERVEGLGMKIGAAIMKSMKYMGDPGMMAAQQRLQKAMASMK